MSDIAIRVEHLSKQYRIGGPQQHYRTLRDSVVGAVGATLHRLRDPGGAPSNQETIWALKDVSFDVQRGEVVGFIGRNGAGKSTLLKLLSRITEPTEGRVEIHGRVGSLLEVGTGFHPELSGRENIFLNGAILGMRRAEINRRFDEIVAFAETERFLDTPVKHYSSGMYVRLAFAVAAHLEPEILLVDEVLSVGDSAFQKKCLGKISEVSKGGRTVFFVSHNLASIKLLCDRAVHLSGGRVVADASADSVVRQYLAESGDLPAQKVWQESERRPGDEQFRLVAVRALDELENPGSTFLSSRPIVVEMEFELAFAHTALCVGFDLATAEGVCAFRSYHTDVKEQERPMLAVGRNTLRCTIPPGLLNAGTYTVSPRVSLHFIKWIVSADPAIQFDVMFDHGKSEFLKAGTRPGQFAPLLDWKAVARDGA